MTEKDKKKPITKSEVLFNQAAHQQERLNDLMTNINRWWLYPTKRDPFLYQYGYELIYSELSSYYREIRTNLKLEREAIDKLGDKLFNYIEHNPIAVEKKQASLYGDCGVRDHFISKRWETIRRALIMFQNKILDAAGSHGMGNPTKKNPSQAAIDRE